MKKGTILLAEENKLSANAIITMHKGKIEQLDWARNTKALMQKYQSTHYDFILLNTWLEDSLEATRKIRAQEAVPNGKFTPIIGLFSDWAGDKNLRAISYRQYFKAGMNEVFPQLLTEEDVNKILEKYIF